MSRRLELQTILEKVLGSKNVYFQPPESVKLTYPCIVYKLNDISVKHANDKPYNLKRRYQITLLDRDPDSGICATLSELPSCRFETYYTANNINHFIFNTY